MAPKVSAKSKRVAVTIQKKLEIINKHESGVKVVDLVREYGLSQSTVSTIIKNKQILKEAKVSVTSSRVYKSRSLIGETERLLSLWINEKRMQGDTLTSSYICERAKAIFSDLRAATPQTSNEPIEDLKASHGWFDRFRKRMNLKSVIRHGEACSADKEAAEKFKVEFQKLVEEENYLPQQVFSVDETDLFWKKMPRRTYITKDETTVLGHKIMKDRLTLLLGANASGDFKLNPLLVYHSETPRAFRQHKVVKSTLGVYWKSNSKAWVTRILFNEWAYDIFCPTVKTYLEKNKLPLKVLLLLDNAPGHDTALAQILESRFDFVKVKFLPPNTTPLLQPMNQQVIANFKKLYIKRLFKKCYDATSGENSGVTLREFWKSHFSILDAVKLIVGAWSDVSTRSMNSAWRPLWHEIIHDFVGFEDTEGVMEQEIITLGQSMGLEVDVDDVEDLVEEHGRELTTEDLQALEAMQVAEHDNGEEEREGDDHVMPTKDLKSALIHWEALKNLLRWHPEVEQTELMSCQFEDRIMSYFKNLKRSRQKQTTLDSYFKRTSSSGCEVSVSKRQKKEETLEIDVPDIIMEGDSPSKQ